MKQQVKLLTVNASLQMVVSVWKMFPSFADADPGFVRFWSCSDKFYRQTHFWPYRPGWPMPRTEVDSSLMPMSRALCNPILPNPNTGLVNRSTQPRCLMFTVSSS